MKKLSIYEQPIRMRTMLSFTAPTMVLMVFTSLYTVVDGIVLSNYVGSLALSATNIVYPLQNICMAVGFMFATGSNAIVARKLGEEKPQEANQFMTLITLVTLGTMAVLVLCFLYWDEQLYVLLGADAELLPYCVAYGRIVIPGNLVLALQVLFQNYLVTADKPRVSLGLSVLGGMVNIVGDIVLVGPLHCGITGAAAASVAGQAIAGLLPLFIFFHPKTLIHFARPRWAGRDLLFSMANGSSEMVSNLAGAVTTTLFNLQMMALIGEKGVAAISAILYLQFIFVAIFLGFTSGLAPVISYHYGAGNKENLHKLFRIGVTVVAVFSLTMFLLSELGNETLVLIFASHDPALKELMVSGFRILAISFLCSGVNIFGSGWFTALNNGKLSAIISTMRTLVFETACLIILPGIMGINGVWIAMPIAEFLAAVIAIAFLAKNRKQYGY